MDLTGLDFSTLMALKDFYDRYRIEPGVEERWYYNPNDDFKIDGYIANERYNMICLALSKKCLRIDEQVFGTPVTVSKKDRRNR